MQLGSAWDWNNPWLLNKQPGKGDLSRRRLLPFCDLAEQIDHSLIRFPGFRRKARNDVAKVGTVELGVFVDSSCKEPLAQRTEWNEADSELFQHRQHFSFRFSPPQRVFALESSDRLDRVCAADRLRACFRKPKVLNLTLLNQVLYRSSRLFDWHVGVNAVLIEQVDGVDPESLERGVGDLFDVLWPAIQTTETTLGLGIDFEPELSCYHHLLAQWGEGLAHEFFVYKRAVRFSGIKKGDAPFNGRPNQRYHFPFVCRRAVAKAHPHAAEADCRYFQVAVSEFAVLHCFSFVSSSSSLIIKARECQAVRRYSRIIVQSCKNGVSRGAAGSQRD